jgi:hypothetical protein
VWTRCQLCDERTSYQSFVGKKDWSTLSEKPVPPSWKELRFAAVARPPVEPEAYPGNPGLERAIFGQYKGMTFQEIYENHPRYCYWILDQAKNKKMCGKGLLRLADFLNTVRSPPPPGVVPLPAGTQQHTGDAAAALIGVIQS